LYLTLHIVYEGQSVADFIDYLQLIYEWFTVRS